MTIINFKVYALDFLFNPKSISEDLHAFILAAQYYLIHKDPYDIFPFVYPPQSILFYIPLVYLSDYILASKLFFIINLILIMLTGFMMVKLTKTNDFYSFALAQLLLFGAGFTAHNLSHGQSDYLVTTFLLAGVLLSMKARYFISGLMFFLGSIAKNPLLSIFLVAYLSIKMKKPCIYLSFLIFHIIAGVLIFLDRGLMIFLRYLEKINLWLEWQGGYSILNIYENSILYVIFVVISLTGLFYITLYKRLAYEFAIPLMIAVPFLIMPFFPSHQIVILIPFFYPIFRLALITRQHKSILFAMTLLAILIMSMQPLLFTGRRATIIYLLFYELIVFYLYEPQPFHKQD